MKEQRSWTLLAFLAALAGGLAAGLLCTHSGELTLSAFAGLATACFVIWAFFLDLGNNDVYRAMAPGAGLSAVLSLILIGLLWTEPGRARVAAAVPWLAWANFAASAWALVLAGQRAGETGPGRPGRELTARGARRPPKLWKKERPSGSET